MARSSFCSFGVRPFTLPRNASTEAPLAPVDPKNRALVFLHGTDPLEALPPGDIRAYNYTLAVDGALGYLLEHDRTPDAVVGDMDSVEPETLRRFEEDGGLVDRRNEQDTTDFEKALHHMHESGRTEVDVTGFHGSRLDHMLAMFHAALQFERKLQMRFIDRVAEAQLVSGPGRVTIEGRAGHVCSVMPILSGFGINIAGFRWPLTDAEMGFGDLISCSNEIVSDHAEVSLVNGALLIYMHREKGKAY
ncbi:thiamine diphosphokinase [bacterium]|nr:thiamine diphosphokinase [bacterium]